MNAHQSKRWFEQQGARFKPGKGSHLRIELNDKRSVLPMHGSRQLGIGLMLAIKKQLGLKTK